MSKATHVPKFGKWDETDPTPYTVIFDKARADHKGGTGAGNKMFNPNDPSENPAFFGMKFSEDPPSSRRPSQQQQYVNEPDDRVDPPNVSGVPARSTVVGHPKKASYGGRGDNGGVAFGEGHHAEQSPHQPSSPFKGRLGNRPSTQPPYFSPDRKGAHEGGIPQHQPAKTRLRPGSRGEDMVHERPSALPKFGAWDEKDPSSGDSYTLIFNHARKEKMDGGAPRVPTYHADSPLKVDHDDAYNQSHQPFHQKAVSWICCFRQ